MRVGSKDLCLHATCVTLNNRGLLISGASGSGKSTLALALMSMGASLVADDRVLLSLEAGVLVARAPEPTVGLIEARGLGLLRAEVCRQTEICAKVDMDTLEAERLPPVRDTEILGQKVTLLHKLDPAYFAPALLQYLRFGRQDPDAGTE